MFKFSLENHMIATILEHPVNLDSSKSFLLLPRQLCLNHHLTSNVTTN